MFPDKTPLDPMLSQSPAWRKIMNFYRTLKPGLRLMKLPLIGPLLQHYFIREDQDANWFLPDSEQLKIPVHAPLNRGKQAALPVWVVEQLLHEAQGIFAMKACPCRVAFECSEHPRDLGCLHLGPATSGIPGELGKHLVLEEGKLYAQNAVEQGLIATILYIPSEAEIFGVDRTRMLSICFCCECCCDVRLMLREGPDRYWDLYNHRLPGLTLTVSDACTHCGICVNACYGGERVITMGSDRIDIGERCIGCGRCAQVCPEGAISMDFDPQVDWMQALRERIREKAEISVR